MSFSTFVTEHGEEVFRSAFRMLKHAADAEDVAQQVFLEVFRKFEHSGSLPELPLLKRMTHLRSIDHMRRNRRLGRLEEVAFTVESNSKSDTTADQAAALRAAIASLPEQQAKAFVLRYLDGLSNRQIAVELNTTPSAISTALHKARQQLREYLETHLPAELRK